LTEAANGAEMNPAAVIERSAEQQSGAAAGEAEHASSKLHDAIIHGDLDACAFLHKPVQIAYGQHKQDKNWINQVKKAGELIAELCEFARNDKKDSRAMMQGRIVEPPAGQRGAQRTAPNQHTNYCILFDNDTGEPIAETIAKIEASGGFAVVRTTFSHGKPTTAIKEGALLKWLAAKGRGEIPTAQDAAEYLQETKHTRPEIFKDATFGVPPKEHIDGGVHYILRHAPMARTRILFLLEKAYVFGNRPGLTQAQAIEDWKAVYAAVAQKIGLPYDTSCIDPSRLMYLNIPTKAVIGDGPYEHQVHVIAGRPLDLDTIERTVTPKKTAGKKPKATFGGDGEKKSSSSKKEWQVEGFGKFWHKDAENFKGAHYVEKVWSGAIRVDKEKADVIGPCPFEEDHSDDTGPTPFYALSPKDGKPAFASCQHAGCKKHTSPEFYDAIAHKLGHSVEYLRQHYVERSQEEIDAEEAAAAARAADRVRLEAKLEEAREALKAWDPAEKLGKNERKLAAAVQALARTKNKKDKLAAVDKLLRAQATQDHMGDKQIVKAIDKLATIGVGILGKQVKACRQLYEAARALPSMLEAQLKQFDVAKPDDHASEWEPCGPIEGDYGTGPLYATHAITNEIRYNRLPSLTAARSAGHPFIWKNWSHNNQFEMAREFLLASDAGDPKLFTRSAGSYARLVEADDQLKLEGLDKDRWTAELHKRMECRIFKEVDDVPVNIGVALAEDVQKRMRGTGGIPLPLLHGFIRTPVFGPDGVIRTERGYQKDLQVYLDPRGTFLPVSAHPPTEEIRTAFALMEEAFVDFPFSDEFEGDQAPYKIGEPDPVTGYRRTNPERGKASRWNTYGALLHTQLFHLLDAGGGAPAVHIAKAVAGEGAGLYMNTLNMIANGAPLPIRTYGGKEEFRKEIPAALSSGDSIIGADNIVGTVDDTALAAMLTSSRYKARKFRSNDVEVDIITTAQWLFAGNGFSFSSELGQRMIPVRLDSGFPRPAQMREAKPAAFFKHVDQLAWLRKNRARLVWALHTLITAWFAAGKPGGTVRHPRFPAYSGMVGGVLEHVAGVLGLPCHFLGNLEGYLATDDDEQDIVTSWAQLIWERYKWEPQTAHELIKLTRTPFGGAVVDIGVDFGSDGSPRDGKAANRAVKDIIWRRAVTLDNGETVRLIKRRQRSPATFALVPVEAA
jgi:hypothetical protein